MDKIPLISKVQFWFLGKPISVNNVLLLGCETDIVKLKLLPESDVNIKSLEVNDRNRIIYHTGSLESLKDVEIFSLTNTPKVTVDVEDTNGLEITYSCQKPM